MAFTSYLGLRLARSEIASLEKAFILRRFHKYIRSWYMEGVLPDSLLEDEDIIPFYTPCDGHPLPVQGASLTENTDCIDGVLQMRAYCSKCKNESS